MLDENDCALADVVFSTDKGILKGYNTYSQKLIDLVPFTNISVSSVCWKDLHQNDDGKVYEYSLVNQTSKLFHNLTDPSKVVSIFSQNRQHIAIQVNGKLSRFSGTYLSNSFQLRGPVDALAHYNDVLAIGGKENNVCVYDMNRPDECIFSAKNCRADTLLHSVPVWVSALSFVPDYDGKLILAASRTGEVQLYDSRCNQRKPVLRTQWRCSRKFGKVRVGSGTHGAMITDPATQRPVTSLNALPVDTSIGGSIRVLVGNAVGDLSVLDCRCPKSCLSFEAKSVGEVRSMGAKAPDAPLGVRNLQPALGAITGTFHPYAKLSALERVSPRSPLLNEPIVLAASLDRHLRVYDQETGKRIAKIFTKVPIHHFLLRDNASFMGLRAIYQQSVVDKIAEGRSQSKYLLAASAPKRGSNENDKLWEEIDRKSSKLKFNKRHQKTQKQLLAHKKAKRGIK